MGAPEHQNQLTKQLTNKEENMNNQVTYKYDSQDSRRVYLKTYWNGYYVGQSVGYFVGYDVLSVYPYRIESAPPKGTQLKRRVYMSEVER